MPPSWSAAGRGTLDRTYMFLVTLLDYSSYCCYFLYNTSTIFVNIFNNTIDAGLQRQGAEDDD